MYEDDPDTPVVHSAVMEQQMETNGKTPEVVSSQLPTPAAIASGPIDFTSIASESTNLTAEAPDIDHITYYS